jgi:pyruvate dehydrogenase E1 component alpha subunit
VFRLPLVFICQNNQWAISVPIGQQTAAETLAQKAIAYGFEGVQVDGNDVFAVYSAVKDALAKARCGNGPTFIECFTYRMADHTTADDAGRYRSLEEVEAWRGKDPIHRLELFMAKNGIWNESYAKEITATALDAVDEAVHQAENAPSPAPEEMIDHVTASLSPRQKRQRDEMMQTEWN